MTTAQINVRIDSKAKELGDRALASIGYTPTNAIRALWEYAGANLHDPKTLRSLFAQLESPDQEPDIDAMAAERINQLEEGPRIIERMLCEMGIEDPAGLAPPDASDEELLAQAHFKKPGRKKGGSA